MAINGLTQASLERLLYQALETEQGGMKVFQAAIACALNDDLRNEWSQFLEDTEHHEQLLLGLLEDMGIDPDASSPGRDIVRGINDALVVSMNSARNTLSPEQAEIVACEAVIMAETMDFANWEVLGHAAKKGAHRHLYMLRSAVDEVEGDEHQHMALAKGWHRESWIQALGLPAILPPLL